MTLMLRRLWIQLTADRKRFGLLCAMMAVGLLLWARVIVVTNIPRTAVAEDQSEVVTAAEQLIKANSFVDMRTRQNVVEVRLDDRPQRDPFVISNEYFPNLQIDEEMGKEQAKSTGKRDDNDEAWQARQRRERLLKHVEKLKLEAVMSGVPLAVISGKTYRLGEHVPSRDDNQVLFELTEVNQRSVILQADGYRFELELKSP